MKDWSQAEVEEFYNRMTIRLQAAGGSTEQLEAEAISESLADLLSHTVLSVASMSADPCGCTPGPVCGKDYARITAEALALAAMRAAAPELPIGAHFAMAKKAVAQMITDAEAALGVKL